MYFQEPRPSGSDAGWFCGCGYRILVRQAAKASPDERRETLTERRAKAIRKSMTTQARAARLRRESERLRASRQRRRK
jgi:hypothetical protein